MGGETSDAGEVYTANISAEATLGKRPHLMGSEAIYFSDKDLEHVASLPKDAWSSQQISTGLMSRGSSSTLEIPWMSYSWRRSWPWESRKKYLRRGDFPLIGFYEKVTHSDGQGGGRP